MCLSQDVSDSIGFWAGLPELQLLPGQEQGQGRQEPEPSDRSWLGEQPSPVLVPGSPSSPRVVTRGVWGMACSGEREASMSVLERLLANAALRDEAGRLRSPEPRARPPSGVSQGKLGGGAGSLVP